MSRKQPESKPKKMLMKKNLPVLQLSNRQLRKKQPDLNKKRLLQNFYRLNLTQRSTPKT